MGFYPFAGTVLSGPVTVQGAMSVSGLLSTLAGILNSGGTISSSQNFAGTGVAGITVPGNVDVNLAGDGLRVAEGANAKQGTATLVAGTVTVANTNVTANSKIQLTRSTAGGTLGHLSYTIIAGTSFTITSSSATDTSTIVYEIFEPG